VASKPFGVFVDAGRWERMLNMALPSVDRASMLALGLWLAGL